MSDFLADFGRVRLFSDSVSISGNLTRFSDIRMIDGEGDTVGIKLKDGTRFTIEVKGKGIDSADNCRLMLYRAIQKYRIRDKKNSKPSYGVVGY